MSIFKGWRESINAKLPKRIRITKEITEKNKFAVWPRRGIWTDNEMDKRRKNAYKFLP